MADAFSLHSLWRETPRISTVKRARGAPTHFEDRPMNPIRIAKSWINYRRTLAELGNLPSHTLADIGITRFDIRNIASRSFR